MRDSATATSATTPDEDFSRALFERQSQIYRKGVNCNLLLDTAVASYHGVDLSGPAIDLASEHVARFPCAATLEHSDFAEALRHRSKPADVVWLGQALHYLDGSSKLAVMRDVRRLLTDHGQFLLREPTRPDGESREAWLERFEERWRSCLHIVITEEWSAMADHVRAADFPETVAAWFGMGEEAGFSQVSGLLQAPFDLAQVYCFRA
jgi:SAM-dependent methyltransferase